MPDGQIGWLLFGSRRASSERYLDCIAEKTHEGAAGAEGETRRDGVTRREWLRVGGSIGDYPKVSEVLAALARLTGRSGENDREE